MGKASQILKSAIIRPLLKNLELILELINLELIFKNYRPVLNVPYLCEIIEGEACQ